MGELIAFWILDFRFWIEKPFLGMGYVNPSVAIIFQIGISTTLNKIVTNKTQKTLRSSALTLRSSALKYYYPPSSINHVTKPLTDVQILKLLHIYHRISA